ncbi:MAG: hypothetical protein AAF674_06005 [Pseudomonadota bacterium]
MTTVITRLYQDQNTADAVAADLAGAGFPANIYQTIAHGDDTMGRITGAEVPANSAGLYAPLVDQGNVLLVVRAPVTPFGAAKMAMEIVDRQPSVEAGVENDNEYVGFDKNELNRELRIMHGHWGDFLFPLLAPHSRFNRDFKLRSRFYGRVLGHLVPGHRYMAKFPFAHIVPGHKFFAKFPFAHIVPGHKFFARFPFDHLVPGHKFFAKFPFDHIIPDHPYMANWIWPHTKSKSS